MRRSAASYMLTTVAAAALLPTQALAARPVHDGAGEQIVFADGPLRPHMRGGFAVPARRQAQWSAFERSMGGRWQAVWDVDTEVPLRIFGAGADAPSSQDSAASAERFARAVLEAHVDLLAPGSAPSDFVLASNVLSQGVRSVGFFQTHAGMLVDGGQVSFRFKADRLVAIGSEAVPNLDTGKVQQAISETLARTQAKKWLGRELGDAGVVNQVEGPMVRAVVTAEGTVQARAVLRVLVRTTQPLGLWAVDLDARTGAPFVRRQTLLFGAGQIAYRVPERRPGQTMMTAPAALAEVSVAGASQQLDADGRLSWTEGATVSVQTSATGLGVQVSNDAGPEATFNLTVEDGGTAVWDPSDDEFTAAQVNAFIHSYAAREHARTIAQDLRFLDDPVQATVNIAEECNAYSDGTGIFFFGSSAMCENTGRLPDVVHHEYGHSIHAHAIIPGVGSFDGALSEGASDYFAATIVNDAGMGRGFFYTDEPLRDLNPEGREWTWPEDQGESHQTGQIIGGALWDLRTYFRQTYGDEEGTRIVDGFWYVALQRASGILAVYPELLVQDDDDGDLSNGTPNLCAITDIFRRAGLTDGTQAGLTVEAPVLDRWTVTQAVSAEGLCPGLDFSEATLSWGRRGAPEASGSVAMTYSDGVATGTMPPQPEGEVMLYKVSVTLTNGEQIDFPNNAADPMYEVFIGDVRPIFCTDFESDPIEAGWISELLPSESRRPRNEWEWGAPAGVSGDPVEAFSGENVVGNDLSDNGRYQGRKSEQLISPSIDVSGVSNVRLQYRRWLNVEDGDADQAQILVGEQPVWSNLSSGTGTVHHEDREWRMHDVDLSPIAEASDGTMQVSFRISSDRSASYGGWTLDDFCLVTWDGPVASCGDGNLDFGELCDDGNVDARDGCEADCTLTPAPVCGDGFIDDNEVCDDGNLMPGDGCEADCTLTPEVVVPTPGLDTDDGCRCVRPRSPTGLWGLGLLGLMLPWLRRRR